MLDSTKDIDGIIGGISHDHVRFLISSTIRVLISCLYFYSASTLRIQRSVASVVSDLGCCVF